ncbi:uncharacterized protein LOC143596688 [Bidens hawaiensis]|uniref:uncharacterized protein LOC143596688 n=1 Tax=Bidens hawaiensis TaxID=980011 RepID=UPI00404A61BA
MPLVKHAEYFGEAEEEFTKPYRPAAFAEKSKFIPQIATAPFPTNIKIPSNLGKYNGMTDPQDHLLNFTAVGGVSGWTLPHCWNDLVAKFSQHFSQQRKHTRDASEILSVIRRDNESLENFITRFNNERLNIGGISEDMLRGAFRVNARSPEMVRCLTGRDGMPMTWDAITSAAKVFAATEKWLGREAPKQQAKNEPRNTRSKKEKKGSIWSRIQPPESSSKQFDARSLIGQKQKDRAAGKPDRQHWTPLKKIPSEILTTENIEFRKPQPLVKRVNLNPNKHCMFHEDIGHDTNECISLKNEIEFAIKSGKLDHLLKNVQQGPRKNAAPADKGPPRKQIKDLSVHMIQEGPSIKFKRREADEDEWKSEPVIFPKVRGGPCMKQPLIVTALFGHYRSQYVFFDTGSTSDIMYEQCFEQLDEEDKAKLKPVHAPFFGFGYEVMHPKGVITFPVTLNDGIHSRTEDVEFLVLPARSKHDIILGREAIGDFNANPSTVHGAVGVPTRTGVAIIRVNKHCDATEGSKPTKVPKKALRTEPEKCIVNPEYPEQTVTIGTTVSETVRIFLK